MSEIISLEIDNEEIVFADLTARENLEIVVVCKSGKIFLFDLAEREKLFLTRLPFNSVPNLSADFNPFEILEELNPDELANLLENLPSNVESLESLAEKNPEIVESLSLNLKLYSFQNYICLVQKNGISGIVLDLSNSIYKKKLERGKYHVEHCSFPIAFYSKKNQTFLIHGTDWNRLDITCLETDELLTNRIVDYETNSNYFDYFHSSLLVSPDAKYFTSNGWVWQPYDIITVYPIDEFLQKFEMSHTLVDFEPVDGYNWDRPLCWIDNATLGIGYNKKEDGESKGDFPSEIVFVDILENKIINRIEFDDFALSEYGAAVGELFFDSEKQQFIGLNEKSGLLISDINGKETLRNTDFTSHKYSPRHEIFYRINCKNQKIEIFKSADE